MSLEGFGNEPEYCSRFEDGNYFSVFRGLITLTAGVVVRITGRDCDNGTM